MLDDIYLRLFLELIPDDLKLNSLDVQRLINQHSSASESKELYGGLIKSVYDLDPGSDIGLRYGRHLWPATLCDFSRTLMTANDIYAALQIVERLHYVHGASFFPVIARQPGRFSLALTFPYKKQIPLIQRRFCAEALFSYIVNSLRETISSQVEPLGICFDFPEPAYSEQYASLCGTKVAFDRPLSIIEFDDKLLHRELSTRNPTLHHMYLNKSLDMWRSSERQQDFEYRTIAYIMLHHPESFNSQKLASKLNISIRGLQKRLNKNGGSFSNLANLARRELAKVYLFQKQQGIDFTSEQLGFQTSSGFRRFFKAEFDLTPAEYIERVCYLDAADR